MKNQLKRILPGDIKSAISYKSTKLSTKFPVKYKIDFQHKYNVVYYGKYPSKGCKDDYVGERKRHIVEKIKDRNSKDNNSHLLKHACENGYYHVMYAFQSESTLYSCLNVKELFALHRRYI